MIPHKNIIKVMLACASLFFITSCWKDKTTTHHIDAGLLKHFNYQVGSYWIYRDSVTGNIDSFAVENNVTTTDPTDLKNTYLESLNMKLGEYHNGTRNDTIKWNLGLVSNKITLGYFISPEKQDGGAFYYPLNILYDTLTINSINHKNLSLYFYKNDISYKLMYISEDIGFIKLKFAHPSDSRDVVWELVRYNIKN